LFCAEKKKTVYIVPQFYELAYARFRIVQFYDTPTFMIDSMGLTFQQRLFKRIFDVAFSILAIIITLPVQLLIILAIKLDSPGPAIYSQERNTIGSRIYNVYKFRTMVKDAEERFGAYQANEADPRLTRVGKILRSMHLDELPQFVNVLIGDMSVVGPRSDRPITINEFEQRIPGYNQRLKVKSGITGLAQVMGKYNTDPEDKLRFDMIYIKNYSMLLDFKIILMSLGAFIPKNRNSKVKTTSDYVVTGEALSDSRDGQKLVKKEDPDIS
jgi:exopolysaccharide biosynthesis polyprenyl glycosylphosphotransferase